MKFVKFIIIVVIGILLQNYNVFAKDIIYSINKYPEENLKFIKSSYNKKGTKDGLIVGGSYLENTIEDNDTKYNNYQIIVAKYDNMGEISWKFTYGNTKEDYIDYLEYTYNEENKIDGYIIALEKTYDVVSQENVDDASATLLKLDLDGNLVWEKTSGSNEFTKITKIISTLNDDKQIDGYLAIGYKEENKKKKACVVRYDKDFNLIWIKQSENQEDESIEYQDITTTQEENKLIGYAMIISTKKEKAPEEKNLVHIDREWKKVDIVENSLEKYQTTYLEKANDGFILYGITSDVKLKKGEKSYYLINYNSENQINWETIGEEPIKPSKRIILYPNDAENIEEYMLLYENSIDSSKEVLKFDFEGNLQKKIKKIKNDYYTFENFYIEKNTLYFVGQINCPEDDNCEYDKNSLLLISDEDTVIEVQDSDSTNIIIGVGIVIAIIGIIIFKKSQRKN